MKNKKCNGAELQMVLVKFGINKLVAAKYGDRRAHIHGQKATKNKPKQYARGVVIESREYMETYKENSIAGRTELREDLAKQLTKRSKAWFKDNKLRSMQLVNAARSLAI